LLLLVAALLQLKNFSWYQCICCWYLISFYCPRISVITFSVLLFDIFKEIINNSKTRQQQQQQERTFHKIKGCSSSPYSQFVFVSLSLSLSLSFTIHPKYERLKKQFVAFENEQIFCFVLFLLSAYPLLVSVLSIRCQHHLVFIIKIIIKSS